jgi:hypothetical protein
MVERFWTLAEILLLKLMSIPPPVLWGVLLFLPVLPPVYTRLWS